MYAPDPAGVFDSDAHRRVLGFVPVPDDDRMPEDVLLSRVHLDTQTTLTDEAILTILTELSNDQLVSATQGGYRMTKAGFDKITGGEDA